MAALDPPSLLPPVLQLSSQEGGLLPHAHLLLKPLGSALALPCHQTVDTGSAQ